MRSDIQDALLSVKEVAVFAWSLLELLVTRILPVAGFLAGHLLLHLGQLLASVVITTAGRREPQAAEYIWQPEEFLEEEANVQLGDDHQNDVESLKSSDKLEERQRDEQAGAAATSAEAAAAAEVENQNIDVAKPNGPTSIDLCVSANDAQIHGSNVAKSALADMPELETPANEVPARVDNELIGQLSKEADKIEKREEATSPTSEGATSTEDQEEMQKRRRSRRRMRVLPPSLSQVKRSIMQRSRRASVPSPSGILPPSPSPIQKQQRGHRRNAYSTIKASSSSDNFIRKFRKQFMVDPVVG